MEIAVVNMVIGSSHTCIQLAPGLFTNGRKVGAQVHIVLLVVKTNTVRVDNLHPFQRMESVVATAAGLHALDLSLEIVVVSTVTGESTPCSHRL